VKTPKVSSEREGPVGEAPTRVEALAAAEACARLLQERFGARQVIFFGSLVGQGPWHADSDIDLAVEGLPPEQFFRAWAALDELLPRGLRVDLVPLEDVYPEVRARILEEVEVPEDPVLALKSLVEDELMALERVASRMNELMGECADPPTWVELSAMASLIHQFYTGAESIFERIALHVDSGLPRSAYWHMDLLNQMAEERPGVRPAVIDQPLHGWLWEYLKFRHFFRHAYGYDLEWARLRPLAEGMKRTLEMLRQQLMSFLEGLVEEEGD
jgi:predicted nucleotidyltransferase